MKVRVFVAVLSLCALSACEPERLPPDPNVVEAPVDEPLDLPSEPEEPAKATVAHSAVAADEPIAPEPVEPRCWADYCPCDKSDPDYGYADITVCRNLEMGVEVDDQIMAAAAAMRDARRSLREHRDEYGDF